MTEPSWKTTMLERMSPAQRESLRDGRGRCRVVKFQDAVASARRVAVQIAADVASGQICHEDAGASTHRRADCVRPRCACSLKRMDTIGQHAFYTLRPGQA